MKTDAQTQLRCLEDLTRVLLAIIGVLDVKLIVKGDEAWVGIRTSAGRPAPLLLQQLDRAAVACTFGLRAVHFGILAD